jgi:hypothetical protein
MNTVLDPSVLSFLELLLKIYADFFSMSFTPYFIDEYAQPAPPVINEPEYTLIIEGQGTPEITLGELTGRILRRYGEPDLILPSTEMDITPVAAAEDRFFYDDPSIPFWVIYVGIFRVKGIKFSLYLKPGQLIRTSHGLQLGESVDKMKSVYGLEYVETQDSIREITWYHYYQEGIGFGVDNNTERVMVIDVFDRHD